MRELLPQQGGRSLSRPLPWGKQACSAPLFRRRSRKVSRGGNPALGLFRMSRVPLSVRQAEEEGHQEDGQQRGRNDAAQHPGAHGALRTGRRPMGERQRNDARPERQGGHQDGPQAQFGGGDGSFRRIHAFPVKFPGHFHNQNGILGGKANGRNQAHFEVDVIGHVAQEDGQQGAKQPQGHDQNNRQRNGPAFIQGRQHQENNGTYILKFDLLLRKKRTLFSI